MGARNSGPTPSIITKTACPAVMVWVRVVGKDARMSRTAGAMMEEAMGHMSARSEICKVWKYFRERDQLRGLSGSDCSKLSVVASRCCA